MTGPAEDPVKTKGGGGGGSVVAAAVASAAAAAANQGEVKRKAINSDLWHACAGPLVSLPPVGSLVMYFPQGHSEQVAASMHKDIDAHIPNYPALPWKMICLLHSVTLHADAETDEVYAQMTLQPVNMSEKEAMFASDFALKPNKPQVEFFCKTLTASDTSTHGGFSVPRRAAEKIFPPLDFSMQPPCQELQARDLHDNVWNFRHIYRGQPKRHLLTTGWSLFVSGKRLFAGDSVLFIRDEKQHLQLGIRRANRQPANIPSSVLSSDSMHIGILAAAAHAAANHSPFTVFYNPRASPSEFVIPLSKYQRAIFGNQISLGMRFRMMFETEESGTRRYMGTITGVNDLDPVRWKNSQWRNLQVGWDESAAGEKRNRVSVWEIEPVQAPFFICPPPFFRSSKRLRQPGMPDDESFEMENLFKKAMPWLGEEICVKDANTQNTVMPGLSLVQWMSMQQNPSFGSPAVQPDYSRSLLPGPVIRSYSAVDLSRQLGFQAQLFQRSNLQFNTPSLPHQTQNVDQLSKAAPPIPLSELASVTVPLQQHQDVGSHQRRQVSSQTFPLNQNLPDDGHVRQQQQPSIDCQPSQTNIRNPETQQQQPQQSQQFQQQQHNRVPCQFPSQTNQQFQLPEHQIQLPLLQKIQQQKLLSSQSGVHHPQLSQLQEHQRALAEQNTKVASMGAQFPLLSSQPVQEKLQPQQMLLPDLPGTSWPPPSTNLNATNGCSLLAAGGPHSALTDDVPSCSTSPSTNNSFILPQSLAKENRQRNVINPPGKTTQPAAVFIPGTLDALASGFKIAKDVPKPEPTVKPLLGFPKIENQGLLATQAYLSNASQMDYLDTSSSVTSACVTQSDGNLQPGLPFPSFNSLSMFRDAPVDDELQADDLRNNGILGVNMDGQLGSIPLLLPNIVDEKYHNHFSDSAVVTYSASKDVQHEPSSSMVSQSFGIPDMGFNSIDSAIDDGNYLNQTSWAAAPQYQRMRTYTKVYKRGAVGRSIDITRYSGYDELKHDLARMFSMEGQLEEPQRVGWKLVYEDHEKDILLVGDDPWDEFVNCVRCIRILSPQEVQQMSLDGNLGNVALANQSCSSSDGGNVWRGGQCDQSSGNLSAAIGSSFDLLEQ